MYVTKLYVPLNFTYFRYLVRYFFPFWAGFKALFSFQWPTLYDRDQEYLKGKTLFKMFSLFTETSRDYVLRTDRSGKTALKIHCFYFWLYYPIPYRNKWYIIGKPQYQGVQIRKETECDTFLREIMPAQLKKHNFLLKFVRLEPPTIKFLPFSKLLSAALND